MAYKLKLPHGPHIHPVFHVSLLKNKVGDSITPSSDLPPMANNGELLLEPEAILDSRWFTKGSKFVEESLIKWKRLPLEDATWENMQDFNHKFLNLNLEDKVQVTERGDKPRRSQRVVKKNPKYLDHANKAM